MLEIGSNSRFIAADVDWAYKQPSGNHLDKHGDNTMAT